MIKNEKNTERIKWTKDYAFCRCLDYSLQSELDVNVKEIDHSIQTYMDIAQLYGIYMELDAFVLDFTQRIPEPIIEDLKGTKPYMTSCLEFRESKELDVLVKSLLKDKRADIQWEN